MGIAPDQLDQIFTPYVQANDSIHRVYGGTGLGLSIVKKIIDLQKGTIDVDSQSEKGTTVTFCLKLPEAKAQSAPTAEPPTLRHVQRVLVGEDDEMSRKVLEQLLQRWGISAVIVSDGQQLLQEAHAHDYDLLITDYRMPKADGAAVMAALPSHYDNAVIILSGESLSSEQIGSARYLRKPVRPEQLRQTVLQVDQSLSSAVEIDLTYLHTITNGDVQLISDLIDTFIRQVPKEIGRMKSALRDQDWPALYLAVHKSKPNFNYVGVRAMQGLLDRFEQDVQAQAHLETYPEHIKQLEKFVKRIIPVLERKKKHLWKSR